MGNVILWSGRILHGVIGALMALVGVMLAVVRSPEVVASFRELGYPQSALLPVGLAELLGAVLYLIPRTSALGAILLTAYLGAAVAAHIQKQDSMFGAPILVCVLLWAALVLRDPAIRAVLPVRR